MKKDTLVRLLFIVALVLSLFNWTLDFVWTSYVGAWEWNSVSLEGLVWLAYSDYFGYPLKASGIAALLCILLPSIIGLTGIIRPRLKASFLGSIITSAVVILSAVVIYISMSILYGQDHTPMLDAGIGTYILGVMLIIEIVAGLIAKRQKTTPISS